MTDYDVVVVGSGTAGQTAAYRLSENGLRVALAEHSDRPGGICALAGCQAKKWFYEVTDIVARSRHLTGKGIAGMPRTDWNAILQQKNRFTARVPENTVKGLTSAGIDLLRGPARFRDRKSLDVAGRSVAAEFIVLASGARPLPLPFAGSEHLITSDAFLELPDLPRRLVFVGGGFISFEFAHFAARLAPADRQITILEVNDRPLGAFDPEMVDVLVGASTDEGIVVKTNVQVTAIEKRAAGFAVTTASGDVLEADGVVHGAGRAPDLDALNLPAAGIDVAGTAIAVNDRMQTSSSRVYAIGDCAATPMLARVADQEAAVAADNILAATTGAEETAHIDYTAAPALLFTYPQYGMVGKTEGALKQEGAAYWKSADKGVGWPTYRRIGMRHAAYKILVDKDNHLLGGHILSDNAAGLIQTLRMAMINGIPADALYRQCVMSPYPSRESDLIYMLAPLVE